MGCSLLAENEKGREAVSRPFRDVLSKEKSREVLERFSTARLFFSFTR